MGDFSEYLSLIKTNELFKTKLENLQLQNLQLKSQLGSLESEDHFFPKAFLNTPQKVMMKGKEEIPEKASMLLMIAAQASVIENFINEKIN